MRHQKDSIKRKQSIDLIAPSIKKDLRVPLLILSFLSTVNFFYLNKKKWVDILKAAVCLVVISDLGLFFLSEAIISL